jgi:type IX secretion system PorP/SprF family membrane protein
MIFRFSVLILFWLGFICDIFAQDTRFSQSYQSPLYLNPAFTGATLQGRLLASYRSQWSSLPGTFTTAAFSFDYNFEKYRSGLGILATNDRVGTDGLQSSSIGGAYSFFLPFRNNWVVRGGLQATYVSRSVNFFQLTFNSQIKDGVFTPNTPSNEPDLSGQSVSYTDVGAGFLAHNQRFWFGASVYHLPRPNQSLNPGIASRLPLRISIQTGIRIPLNANAFDKTATSFLIPQFSYRLQGVFQQLDAGIFWQHYPVQFGLLYRGFPFQTLAQGYANQDAAVIAAGYRFQGLQLHYSYDVTLSRISGSGGSHEVSVGWEFGSQDNQRQVRSVPFPGFISEKQEKRR